MTKWVVIVWDIRDWEATEPSSEVGTYYTQIEAEFALAEYFRTLHGPYIYKSEIREVEL